MSESALGDVIYWNFRTFHYGSRVRIVSILNTNTYYIAMQILTYSHSQTFYIRISPISINYPYWVASALLCPAIIDVGCDFFFNSIFPNF